MFKHLIPWHKHPKKEELHHEPGNSGSNSLTEMFESVFDRFRENFGLSEADSSHSGWGCDMKDSDQEIVVRAEAPGFEPDEIDVKMSGNQLVLEAEHRDQSENGDHVTYGRYYRSMTVPRGIDSDKITAEYKNGVLEVHLPKGTESSARRIPIKAK